MYKLFLGQLLCCIFAFQNFLICETLNPIQIVYHVATMNNWEIIVKEQIDALIISGLGDACDGLTVTVVGPDIDKVYTLFEGLSFSNKVQIAHAGENLHLYEFPGIEKVQQIAQESPNAKILYMHTNGVSYYGTPYERNINQWRRFMEYFSVNKWRDCIEALKNADVCGVDWGLADCGIPCFAGNFWWTRADYATKCILRYNSRYDCELFIGTANPVAKNFLSSGFNPRLREFFSNAQIASFQMFSPECFWHKGVFHWYHFYYDNIYYHDRE